MTYTEPKRGRPPQEKKTPQPKAKKYILPFMCPPQGNICKHCYRDGEFKCGICRGRICDEHMIQDEDGSNRMCLECEEKKLKENQ